MKTLYIKDKNRRSFYNVLEKKKKILYFIVKNLNISLNKRTFAYKCLVNLSNISAISRIRNRCVFSNRPRAVYRKFKLSRIFFKSYALQGILMGVRKSS
jgi:small subunit ribosomal protein S14